MFYNVTWESLIEADNAEEAAAIALRLVRDETIPATFVLWNEDGEDTIVTKGGSQWA